MKVKDLRLGYKIIATLVKDRFYYPVKLAADAGIIIGRCGVLLLLYWSVFKLKGGVINGVDFPIVAWSMFAYFAFSILNLRHITRLMKIDIMSGSIETLLSKPISYLSYRMWWQIGLGIYPFLVLTPILGIILYLVIGLPATMTNLAFWLTMPVVFLLSIVLMLLLYGMLGLAAFWIEDIRPIFWIFDKIVMILGGSYLPIALFPNWLLLVSVYSPFGAAQFLSHTVNPDWQANWLSMISIQLFWIVFLGLIVYYLFSRAQRRVTVNGG